MKFVEILAISGQPGLYKYVARSTKGVIVESLLDGRRFNATGTSKVSSLSEISVFTENDDMPLSEVFTKIYAYTEGKKAIDHKADPQQLKAFMAAALPEYDRDRVRVSDMKKMIAWYNILVDAGMTDFSTEAPQEENADDNSEKKEVK